MRLRGLVGCGAAALATVLLLPPGAEAGTAEVEVEVVEEPDATMVDAAAEALRARREGVSAAAGNNWGTDSVAVAATPTASGCWTAQANGTVATLAGAPARGGASHLPLNGPMVGMSPTASGNGYWLVAKDGGIFTYGDAKFLGSMGSTRLNQPVFSMAPTKDGRGYWLVAYDGGIFTFGNAGFYGSMGSVRLNQPVNGLFVSPSGKGYQMVAKDGGVFNFGDSKFYGSLGHLRLDNIVGLAPTPTGKGYWLLGDDPKVYPFGDAKPINITGVDLAGWSDVVGIVSNPVTPGFRVVYADGYLSKAYGADPCNLVADPRWSDDPQTLPGGFREFRFPDVPGAVSADLVPIVDGWPPGSTGPSPWCADAFNPLGGVEFVDYYNVTPTIAAVTIDFPPAVVHGACSRTGVLYIYDAADNLIDVQLLDFETGTVG